MHQLISEPFKLTTGQNLQVTTGFEIFGLHEISKRKESISPAEKEKNSIRRSEGMGIQ